MDEPVDKNSEKNLENYRFERKYVYEHTDIQSLIQHIKLSPLFLKEIYHERIINNIYFDNYNYQSYKENVDGLSQRQKIRIRWYGENLNNINKGILEFKIKEGLLGTKKSFKLNPFELSLKQNSILHNTDFHKVFKDSNLSLKTLELLNDQLPTLINQYRRRYFITYNKSIRLTIDWALKFRSVPSYKALSFQRSSDNNRVIVELKYQKEHRAQAELLASYLPVRLDKSSKYVYGLDLCSDLNL